MEKYFSQNYKKITYPVDSAQSRGLRNAQLGAVHAIASFFTINQRTAAITVMPTGAGKTAVLMLVPYLLSKNKVLVVTPSTMVRGQIAEDFQNLSTLCRANVFKESMAKPAVFEMQHKYKDDMIAELDAANVIVASPQCALSLSETDWAIKNITLVEVDEAHHSSASKVWSSTYKNLPDYIQWVDEIGRKITNSTIKVKTNTNYDFIPIAEKLEGYPENIFFGDFSDRTYSSPPIVKSRSTSSFSKRLIDFTIKIEKVEEAKVTFLLEADDISESYACDLQGNYITYSGDLYTHIGTVECPIANYLNDNPISFKTYDDALISGFEIYRGSPNALVFDQSKIEAIDWDEYGTDTSVEFTTNASSGTVSIQDTLRNLLQSNSNNKYILYDHGSGEIADYIAIQEDENRLTIRLYHVKKHSSTGFNSSMEDIYEVAGQAVKSIIWLTTKGKFIDKISSRHGAGHCQLLNGNYNDFIKELRATTKQITGYIVIVQPALSKSVPMPNKIQEVLAAASSYISRAGKVKGLEILGSK